MHVQALSFEQFKQSVMRLAKQAKKGYMVPNADFLYSIWQQGTTPQEVVDKHCTLEAQQRRHKI